MRVYFEWLSSKESVCNAGDHLQCWKWRFSPWAGKIPWRKKLQTTPAFLPRETDGQRSVAGYNPWGLKELNTTKRLTLHRPTLHTCMNGLHLDPQTSYPGYHVRLLQLYPSDANEIKTKSKKMHWGVSENAVFTYYNSQVFCFCFSQALLRHFIYDKIYWFKGYN